MSFNEKYKNIKNLVKEELSIIEEKMVSAVNVREPLNSHIIRFLTSPSKRIRPTLAILYTRACGNNLSDNQLEFLSAIELVHNASLIHDDIIDESEFRRGNKTLSTEFGNKLGVISGDYILSVSMEKIAQLNSAEIFKILSQTLKQMCIGEINQNFDRFKIGTIENYIEKSKNKTAYLFAAALTGCAILGEKNLLSPDLLEDFGLNIGIAFQIRDDLGNLTSPESSKPVNNDIKEGIYNAPVIYSQNVQDYTFGIEKTRSLLNNYVQRAYSQVNTLPENEYTKALREFLELLNNE